MEHLWTLSWPFPLCTSRWHSLLSDPSVAGLDGGGKPQWGYLYRAFQGYKTGRRGCRIVKQPPGDRG
ncbi:hypothetical protein Q5P01_021606 [Channa striata]|uniref:Uncharacterized protein n=1 Tax=Channa striata TaxID=64152 RepID=A0AA88LUN7_CHASR|nr:hypothetical protein Q5P01_021606 [Channa striata]